jgi:sucrose-6-phosphate hydrolase SacC (GH32 family)
MQPLYTLLILLTATGIANAHEPVTVIRGDVSTSEAPHGKGNVYAAEIIRHRNTLLMYYGGQGRDGHDRIHLATSPDGKTWNPQGVVFAPQGINHVNDPSVVVVNGTFYMYYTRANVGVTDCVGLATSTDGRKWSDRGAILSPQKEPAWDSLLVGRPSVIHDGRTFRLWYDGRADLPIGAPDKTAPKSPSSQRYIGYAESNDGVSWKRHDNYVFAKDSGGIHVSSVGSQYVMMIESRDGTKWASSDDGISWVDKGLLLAKDDGTSPHGHVTPFLFANGNKHVLYFGAARSEHWNQNLIMRCDISSLSNAKER